MGGKNEEDHDRIMAEVLKRAKAYNVTFNSDKMQYKKSEITFVGHIFSDRVLKVNEKNKSSIALMKTPADKAGVNRFLGMLKYVARFIPNLSKLIANLRQLKSKVCTNRKGAISYCVCL